MLGGEGFGLRGLGFYVYEVSITSCSSPYMKPKESFVQKIQERHLGFRVLGLTETFMLCLQGYRFSALGLDLANEISMLLGAQCYV